ncbi:MAG: ABC transporter permease [Palaeococcus sp.]|uniref:ABC transporter permease subunit n=1 Tax=Palaeococcus sp. (in: euryarchaeotes) TaxID=2820298 RepID=UPI0025D70295|nr:ABC transporter permease subunit [Palaeococcus sp. (in: euryarchaeotes)]MCD6558737.1 ABC transporter permease [Palaeococcus sp. (in: euryarchaeotes)]
MWGKAISNIYLKELYTLIQTRRFVIIVVSFVIFAVLEVLSISPGAGFGGSSLERELLSRVSPFTDIFLPFHKILMGFVPFLGILLGADLVNRELQKGTLKVTLGHPIYRDQFYIGKFLGAGMVLLIGLTLFYLTGIGLALIKGIPVTLYDLKVLCIIFPITLAYALLYMGLGAMLSVFIKNPKSAIIFGLILVLIVEVIYPMVAFRVSSNLAIEEIKRELPSNVSIEYGAGLKGVKIHVRGSAPNGFEFFLAYQEKSKIIYRKLTFFVPGEWYKGIISRLMSHPVCVGECGSITGEGVSVRGNKTVSAVKYTMGWEGSLWDNLSPVWDYAFLLAVFPGIFLLIGYLKFIQLDLCC